MTHWCSRCNAEREMLPLARAGLALCSHCGKARYDEPSGAQPRAITRAPAPHECPRCMELTAHELADGHSACYQCGWSGATSAADHPERVGGERWFKEMSKKDLPPGRSSSGGGKSRNEKSGSFLNTPLARVDWFEEERHRCRMREHRERRAVRLSAELRRQVAALSAGAGLSVSQMILAAMHAQLELWIDQNKKDAS